MSELVTQLLEVVLVFGNDVFGDRLVAAVRLVETFLEEATEQRAEQFRVGQRHTQLAQELAAHTIHTRQQYTSPHLTS